MSMNVTQLCDFECCYLIDKTLNAHRYRIEVTVDGPQREEDYGSVIEFNKLSDYLKAVVPNNTFLFDTSTQNSGRDVAFILGQRGISICGLAFNLSAENICNYVVSSLQSVLNKNEPGVRIVSAKLRENSTSFVTWKPDYSFVAN